ncbi:hypothetical protein BJ508DRAFT_330757 [Ascobolus immersus RN42]|uniref:Cora-domain-containing protein n=1 Tax=Ascobolus immersus RN42 TaxID=1160509 RepID=A0A3N4HSP3_ASCIM|nr:hypothetical protein BJ508DRAFT_330757 [Ascobolus immersus RN42]
MARAVLDGEKETRSIRIYKAIADSEKATKHGHYWFASDNDGQTAAKKEMQHLTELSSALSATITRIKFGKGNLDYINAALEAIKDSQAAPKPWQHGLPKRHRDSHDASMGQICTLAPLLQRQINGFIAQYRFSEQRASTQMTVIFNLLTHSDAQSSLEQSKLSLDLARSNQELAEAMRRDSSSMKTVAVMTMVFLPGTFFSALFAMPFIRIPSEESDGIIQKGFALYWGLTIASTAIVFTTWFMTTHRSQIADRYRVFSLRAGHSNAKE